jgi:hypothetical protein
MQIREAGCLVRVEQMLSVAVSNGVVPACLPAVCGRACILSLALQMQTKPIVLFSPHDVRQVLLPKFLIL